MKQTTESPKKPAGWAPSGHMALLDAVGVYWDAVRVPFHLGLPVVSALGDSCGSVISDPYGSRVYWLIPPRADIDWGSLPATALVRHLGETSWVLVPSLGRVTGPGAHWVVPYRDGGYLTDASLLHAALSDVIAAMLGPREGEQR